MAALESIESSTIPAVTANKKAVAPNRTARLLGGVKVQAVSDRVGRPAAVVITSPRLRIEAQQRPAPGGGLDVFVTVLRHPLPTPVKGLMGAGYRPPKLQKGKTAPPQTASLVGGS